MARQSPTVAALRPKLATETKKEMRPKAPDALNKSQQAIWQRIVDHTNASTSPDQHDLLIAYCRNADYSQKLSQQVEFLLDNPPAVNSEEYAEYIKILEKTMKVYSATAAAMTSLSVKLRIANSAWRDYGAKSDNTDEFNTWDDK
ncbi:hypothetical protein [Rhodobacter capsulatus]|uniref:hypothetical protein n=1 Tax=Rhodobacter capsulatus TaxID=1061 RepID=UPI0040264DD1